MYPVSEAYKEAMRQRVQKFKVRGTVGDVHFDDSNILAGSLSITNQCSSSDNIEIGQVYIGELDCTFLGLNIGRYEWYGKAITISFGQCLANGTHEYIPLGVFYVAEAEYTASGVVVKAYDCLSKLDKTCSSLSSGATPYNLARSACVSCGVELETTEGEFKSFSNGKTTLTIYPENDIQTYRDAVSWIAQTCGCFVTASRSGGIVFKNYGSDVVDTIDDEHRFTGCSFSDFSTRYTGMSVVDMAKQETNYYALTPDDALTYNLGSNPYLQIAVSHSITTMRSDVLNALSQIDYVPFKATCIGNPAYDLGDVLVFSGGLADGNKKYCITKYTWNYGSGYSMEGVGKNPALASAASKSDKNIAGLMSQAGDDLISYTVLRNGEAIEISEGEAQSVLFARYLVSKPCHVRFNFEILLTVVPGEETSEEEPSQEEETHEEEPAVSVPHGCVEVKAIYKLDGEEITDRYPIETWTAGRHILTLQYDLNHDDSISHFFELWLEVTGGSVIIAERDAYEVISSTGLAANNDWQGIFRADDGNLYIVINGKAYRIPDSITIGRYPNKIAYEPNERLDYTGLDVIAIYGDGSIERITHACTLNPKERKIYDDREDKYVEVRYTTWGVVYETGFDLTYNYITELEVTPPEKLDYYYGEPIDYTGLQVMATYRDGTHVDVTEDCEIVPAEGTLFDYYSEEG